MTPPIRMGTTIRAIFREVNPFGFSKLNSHRPRRYAVITGNIKKANNLSENAR
jgi:hypothetical protein